mmetsp:Transcript_38145/g.89917  ORF Transcript_38145/g.89917 Transcript_38145/m.89917 type:complete len:100 (-) Transcript_38145:39-338(-)
MAPVIMLCGTVGWLPVLTQNGLTPVAEWMVTVELKANSMAGKNLTTGQSMPSSSESTRGCRSCHSVAAPLPGAGADLCQCSATASTGIKYDCYYNNYYY